jgi:hypothetical protein
MAGNTEILQNEKKSIGPGIWLEILKNEKNVKYTM